MSGVNRGVARDMSLRSGHPIGIQPIPVLAGSKSIIPDLIVTYARSARVHPPKRGSCMRCGLPGWRGCNNTLCWSQTICAECASGGVTCLCQGVWACDHAQSIIQTSSFAVRAATGRSVALALMSMSIKNATARTSAMTAPKKSQM